MSDSQQVNSPEESSTIYQAINTSPPTIKVSSESDDILGGQTLTTPSEVQRDPSERIWAPKFSNFHPHFKPHHVFIRTVSGVQPERECMGNLVTGWHVLTLASCVFLDNIDPLVIAPSRPPQFLKIRIGSMYSHKGGVIDYSDTVCYHPDWLMDKETGIDLAVVQLSKFQEESEDVAYMTFHSNLCLIGDFWCAIYSWKHGDDGPLQEIRGDVRIADIEKCLSSFQEDVLVEPDYMCIEDSSPDHVLPRFIVGGGVMCHNEMLGFLTANNISSTFRFVVRIDNITNFLDMCFQYSSVSRHSHSAALIIFASFILKFC